MGNVCILQEQFKSFGYAAPLNWHEFSSIDREKCCLNKTVERQDTMEVENRNPVEYEIVIVPFRDYWNQFVLKE